MLMLTVKDVTFVVTCNVACPDCHATWHAVPLEARRKYNKKFKKIMMAAIL